MTKIITQLKHNVTQTGRYTPKRAIYMAHRRLNINQVYNVATGENALKKVNHIIRELLKRSSLDPNRYKPHKRLKLYQVMKFQIHQAVKYHASKNKIL